MSRLPVWRGVKTRLPGPEPAGRGGERPNSRASLPRTLSGEHAAVVCNQGTKSTAWLHFFFFNKSALFLNAQHPWQQQRTTPESVTRDFWGEVAPPACRCLPPLLPPSSGGPSPRTRQLASAARFRVASFAPLGLRPKPKAEYSQAFEYCTDSLARFIRARKHVRPSRGGMWVAGRAKGVLFREKCVWPGWFRTHRVHHCAFHTCSAETCANGGAVDPRNKAGRMHFPLLFSSYLS